MIIVADIGNSYLKLACWDGQRLDQYLRILHRGVSASELKTALEPYKRVANEGVYIASVANRGVEQAVESWLFANGHGKPVFIKASKEAGGVRSAYLKPDMLGVDRWCAMIAARAQQEGPLCVVDAGTAMTIDWVSVDGQHRGGMIMPGPTLQSESLLSGTAQVRGSDNAPAGLFADNTADAVVSGACYSCASLLTHAVEEIEQSEKQMPVVFVTGGEAARIIPLLRIPIVEQKDLVLEGVARLAEETGE